MLPVFVINTLSFSFLGCSRWCKKCVLISSPNLKESKKKKLADIFWRTHLHPHCRTISRLPWYNKKMHPRPLNESDNITLCVCEGIDEELCNVCDAACQQAVTKHGSVFRCTQPFSALPPSPPLSLFLPHTQLSPPFFCFFFPPFSSLLSCLLFFCAARTHSSSPFEEGTEEESQVIFYLFCF